MILNLSLLGFFKYGHFLTANYTALVESLGLTGMGMEDVLRVTLPLGISFYTFQSMSYTIDVYRGDAAAIRNPIDYWCYVAMFPQLVAGPIVRFSGRGRSAPRADPHDREIRPWRGFPRPGSRQEDPAGQPVRQSGRHGVRRRLDPLPRRVGRRGGLRFSDLLRLQRLQRHGDRPGADAGIHVRQRNFDSPYLSQSITEFWRRWHLSLSTWLRDNLYIPLGGNRSGAVRTRINLMLVMLLGGLWHGASWNFVLWGAIHGLMLILERQFGKRALYERLPGFAKTMITFVIICFTWVFFRAADLPAAVQYCQSMLGLTTPQPGAGLVGGLIYQPYYLGSMLLAAIIAWYCPQTWNFTGHISWKKALWITAVFWLAIVAMTAQEFNPFIYFIF